jgi:hypothetical protein
MGRRKGEGAIARLLDGRWREHSASHDSPSLLAADGTPCPRGHQNVGPGLCDWGSLMSGVGASHLYANRMLVHYRPHGAIGSTTRAAGGV